MNPTQYQDALALAAPYGAALTEDTCPAYVIQGVPALAAAGCIGIRATIVSATYVQIDVDYGAGYVDPVAADRVGMETVNTTHYGFLFATYTTMGALIDAINGVKMLRAYLVGAIRATASVTVQLAMSNQVISGANGKTVYFDGSAKTVGIAISGEKFVNNGVNGWVKEGLNFDAALNQLIYATFTATYTTISTSALFVHFSTQTADTQVYTAAIAATTVAKTLQAASADLQQLWATAPPGSRIVVQAVIAAGTTLTTIDRFDFMGKTAILSGKRIVNAVNF